MSGLRLLTVHAHPDDETIFLGGTLAVLGDRGVTTSVLCCTDGKLATIYAKDMPEETTRPRLAAIRQDELRAAAAILGVAEVNFLEYGDSGMAGSETNRAPDAFWMAGIDEAVGRVVAHIRRFRPQVVVTYDGYGGYGHPDHVQTHRVTALAVEAAQFARLYPGSGDPWRVSKLYYCAFPVSAMRRAAEGAAAAGIESLFGTTPPDELEMVVPDDWVTTTVDARAGVARMRAALRAHRTQMPDDFPFLVMTEDAHREFLGSEHFRLAMSTVPTAFPESDLFAGIATPQLVDS